MLHDHMADQLVIRIQVLLRVPLEVDPQPVKLLKIENRFRNPLSREPIQRPDQHHIKLSFAGIFKESVEALAFTLPFRPALVVHIFIMYHVALPFAELSKLGELILDVLALVLRGHPSVERDLFWFLRDHGGKNNVRCFASMTTQKYAYLSGFTPFRRGIVIPVAKGKEGVNLTVIKSTLFNAFKHEMR